MLESTHSCENHLIVLCYTVVNKLYDTLTAVEYPASLSISKVN